MNIHVRVKLIKNPKGQFIQGLHNETLQTDILAKAEYLKCLENIIKHAEAFESALWDQAH